MGQKQYKDIIHLQHHVSNHHRPMSRENRAAQFSPFAAVAGYEGAIQETGRLTEKRITLNESALTVLDAKIKLIQKQLEDDQEIEVIYFSTDSQKYGGAYVSKVGIVNKIHKYDKVLEFKDGIQIAIDDIVDIKGEMFHLIEDFFA